MDKGWSCEQVAEALRLDDDTIRGYEKRFLEGGVKELLKENYQAKESKLTPEEEAALVKDLTEKLFHTNFHIIGSNSVGSL